MLNLLPDTIAVAFALAVTSPSAISKPLPVTDKLHLPMIVTLPVPILYLLPVMVGTAPAFVVTVPLANSKPLPVTGTSLGIEASALPIPSSNPLPD